MTESETIAKLRNALAFYADEANNVPTIYVDDYDDYESAVYLDGGNIAREALA